MKKKQSWWLLFLIIAVGIIIALGVLSDEPAEEANSSTNEVSLLENTDQIEHIKVFADQNVEVEKNNEDWQLVNNEQPVDTEKMNSFVSAMKDMKGEETDVKKRNVNLGFPRVTVAFTDASGEKQQISIGQLDKESNRYYVAQSEQDKIYLVDSSVIQTIPLKNQDLLQTGLLSISADALTELKIDNGTEEIVLSNEPVFSEEESLAHISGWYMHKPYQGVYSVAYSKMEEMLLGLEQIQQTGTASADEDHGLDNAAFTITFSAEEKSETLLVGNPAAENQYYVKLKGEETIYTVPTDVLDPYSYKAFDMIDHFVDIVALEVLSELKITTSAQSYNFTFDHEENDSEIKTTVHHQEETVNTEDFRAIYQSLAGLRFDEPVEDVSNEEAELTIEYTIQSQQSKITHQVSFIPLSDETYAVKTNDNPAEFSIKKEKVTKVLDQLKEIYG
ncbi:DUF4340 domain-containing protein [Gracilibacillus caseinilyticus]|uniref:DUF4340 domain-containing protein n=1 Tax=Gracilibacillus caseinilyticus TaxID=2932256 RepID=A0ABY4EVG2_9BACI|nr:DUF4340 domain-containing protein [Gracilibacillus caseinilyticus]UOQ48369.1 DUF4340 domain-containing protein [Gracilibacillus caseinilyticus]